MKNYIVGQRVIRTDYGASDHLRYDGGYGPACQRAKSATGRAVHRNHTAYGWLTGTNRPVHVPYMAHPEA